MMKGSYQLIIHIKKSTTVKIGKLGQTDFEKGTYIYIGSAMNNLDARIQRHLKPKNEKKIHWHIDYLLSDKNVKVINVIKKLSTMKEECIIANKVFRKSKGCIPGFGCSDCKCRSHLFRI
jgi:Uri superfamily endonuclease